MWGVIIILLAVFIIGNIINDDQRKINQKRAMEDFLKSNDAPQDCKWFSYISGYPNLKVPCNLFIWRDDDFLYLLSETKRHKIPLNEIDYYAIKGDIRQETGHKGKGVSLSDTMITEGLFGTAAAMKRNQEIPQIKIVDERRTIINANIDDKNCFIFFKTGDLYNYLLEQLPEKEQSFVTMR